MTEPDSQRSGPTEATSKRNARETVARRSRRILWHVLVLALVATLSLHYIDWRALYASLTSIKPEWLLLLLVLSTVDRFSMAAKWHHLLTVKRTGARYWTAVAAYYQAIFLQRIVPISLSGDAIRAYTVIRARPGQSSGVLASMVAEKLVGMVAALFIAAAVAPFVYARFTGIDATTGLLLIVVTVLLFPLAITLSFHRDWILGIVKRIPVESVRAPIATTYGKYWEFSREKKALGLNLVLALAQNLLQIGILVICAKAIGLEASIALLFAAVALSRLIRKFAILAEGWVLAEFSHVLVCVALGIPQTQALAFSLLGHMIGFVASLPGAPLLLTSRRRWADLHSAGDGQSMKGVRDKEIRNDRPRMNRH